MYGPSGAVDFAGAEDFFVAFSGDFLTVFFALFFAFFFAVAMLPAYRATASERK